MIFFRALPIAVAFFLYLLCATPLFGQIGNSIEATLPTIVPPSPSAYNFSTFGNIPLNNSSGAFTYSLPIHSTKFRDLPININLDYASNGLNIDEVASIVGLGWNLNVGGVISRVMKGKPDELSNRWYPTTVNTSTDFDKIKDLTNPTSPTIYDTERDWFSFNVNGISGNFYFDENLKVHVNSKEYVKIEYTPNGSTNVGYGVPSIFTIVDSRGYKYIFGGSHDYQEAMQSTNNCSSAKQFYYSAWFLKEIVSPTSSKINFKYRANDMTYSPGKSYSLVFDEACYNVNAGQPRGYFTNSYSECTTINTIKSQVLSEIQFGGGVIFFDYNAQRQDNGGVSLKEVTIKDLKGVVIKRIGFYYDMVRAVGIESSELYRLFLNNIKFMDNLSVIGEVYSFEYYSKEKLPGRLSLNRDRYGYYNGSANISPFSKELINDQKIYTIIKNGGNQYVTADVEVKPDFAYFGMLKTVRYPTGGYTQIDYEGNSTEKLVDDYTYSTGILEILKNCKRDDRTTFKFLSNGGDINFTGGANLDYGATQIGCQEPIGDPIHDIYTIRIKDLTTGAIIFGSTGNYGNTMRTVTPCSDQAGDYVYEICPINTIKDHQYEISLDLGAKSFNASRGTIDIQYNRVVQKKRQKVYFGGVRVRAIQDYSNGSSLANKRTFYYNELNKYPSDSTSLGEIATSKYYVLQEFMKKCDYGVPGTNQVITVIVPSKKLQISSSSLLSLYGNRKQQSYYTVVSEFFENGTSSNGAIERSFFEAVDAPPFIMQGFDFMGVANSNVAEHYYGLLKNEKIFRKESTGYKLSLERAHNYYFNINEVLRSWVFGETYPMAVSYNNDVSNVSILYYLNYLSSLSSQEIVEQDLSSGSPISRTTKHIYGNSPYFNLETTSQSTSFGETLETRYRYAPDLIGQIANMDKLVAADRVGEPIITELVKRRADNTELPLSYLKKELGLFASNSLLMPSSVFQSKTAASAEKRILFDLYNDKGNLIQYGLEKGSKTVYLWGYNNMFPIAEIKNATYAQVTSIISDATIKSIADKIEPTLADFNLINALRTNNILKDAQVITYTYRPLVGMASSTDSTGRTTYYEYDGFGRLKAAKDTQQKTKETFDYHYLNQ